MKNTLFLLFCLSILLLLGSCRNDIDPPKDSPTVIPAYYIDNLCSHVDEGGNLVFSWQYVNDGFDHLDVSITSADGSYSNSFSINDTNQTEFEIPVSRDKIYSFSITTYGKDGAKGKSYSDTRFFPSESFQTSLPRIEITTKDYEWPDCDYVTHPEQSMGEGITNNDYVMMDMSLYDKDGVLKYSSNGKNESKIKIRGNTSAYGEKKPYKIKLDKKDDLMSYLTGRSGKQYKDKEWLLMASGTSLNTPIGFSVNECMGIEFTPSYSYVELFINGDYRGIYLLVESIKQGNTDGDKQSRCAVADDGFIIENDPYWWNEDVYFRTDKYHKNITFKYPDSDDITAEQINYIKNYLNTFEKALAKPDDSYLQYIDADSFVAWVMVHEYIGCYDAGGSNQYMIKRNSTDETKLEMTTAWDFDWIMSSYDKDKSANMNRSSFFYSRLLLRKESFKSLCKSKYTETKDSVLSFIHSKLDALDSAAINAAGQNNAIRWQCDAPTVEQQLQAVDTWFASRLKWMDIEYGK